MSLQDKFFSCNGSLNSARTRGRIFEAMGVLPGASRLADLSKGIIATAHTTDNTLEPVLPTHMLMLLYTASKGMGYHVDDDPNDGDGVAPIVSLTIGTGCLFGVKLEQPDSQGNSTIKLKLRSGDAVVFGGQSRMVSHSVVKVLKQECPAPPEVAQATADVGGGRLNFTFRHAPSVFGHEHAFAYYDPVTKTAAATAF